MPCQIIQYKPDLALLCSLKMNFQDITHRIGKDANFVVVETFIKLFWIMRKWLKKSIAENIFPIGPGSLHLVNQCQFPDAPLKYITVVLISTPGSVYNPGRNCLTKCLP